MHFRPQSELEQLERGSTNASFSADFDVGCYLRPMPVRYECLLAAICGLISFGDALWYGHVRRLLSRVKRFVLANLERDHNTLECVNLTLLYVNQFLGRALSHLLVGSPHWWRFFCNALQSTTNGYDTTGGHWWGPYDVDGTSTIYTASAASHAYADHARPHPTLDSPRSRRPRALPALLCLCYGGSVSRYAHQRHTHRWVAENCKITSSAPTTQTAATPVAVTVLEESEALTVHRRFGIHAKPILAEYNIARTASAARSLRSAIALRTEPIRTTVPKARASHVNCPMVFTFVQRRHMALLLSLTPRSALIEQQSGGLGTQRRAVPDPAAVRRYAQNAEIRAGLWNRIRSRQLNAALGQVGLRLPPTRP
ncbi:hypothetical protein GQ600_26610 [Phytophthora cactorum]|nr:hypothetical protein GQ600_26610 [Phytophthora cactorum]